MIDSPAALAANLAAISERIAAACTASGREPDAVRLIAVTKALPPVAVRWGVEAGLTDFGENYVQELEAKRDLAPGASWHFLGRIQSNKAARIARADLVHSLQPGRGARRLGRAGAERGRPVRCLIQVDLTGRARGVAAGELPRALDELRAIPGLDVAGLMTIPDPTEGTDGSRRAFAALRELRDRTGQALPELSMGMSSDYTVAVEEGATMVRVGTALFGPRPTT